MRTGSIVINASRGNVVDLDALAEALNGSHIGGAAIDVFPVEPRSNNDEFISPLRGLDQCILIYFSTDALTSSGTGTAL